MADNVVRILTAEDILSVDDTKIVPIEVPEWNGTVYIRTLKAFERDLFTQSLVDKDGKPTELSNFRAKTLSLGVCDSEGKRLFTTKQAADLGQKSSAVVERLFKAINDLNGITAEEVKEMEENFGTAGETGDFGSV